jgi:RimK-like ATP-grasp domain
LRPSGFLVLLWGLRSDPPLAAVLKALSDLKIPFELIDQRQVLETELRLEVGAAIHGSLRTFDHEIDLTLVHSAYVRPYDTRELPHIASAGAESPAWQHALQVNDILATWSEITPALVVNRLGATAGNGSKPYQLQDIRRLGFNVPETLVTTDPDAALKFWEQHGTVIYKSVSAVRSRVARLRPEHTHRLRDVSACPTQFQEFVAGIEHRVHVVGEEVFACEVICEADDYRYPDEQAVEVRPCQLPEEVEDRSRRMAVAMNLSLAGIDLRKTPDGEWYCFEVNPSPGFTYYEGATGQPIANAVARLLANGAEAGGPRSVPKQPLS